jgi:WD40 repeat protein
MNEDDPEDQVAARAEAFDRALIGGEDPASADLLTEDPGALAAYMGARASLQMLERVWPRNESRGLTPTESPTPDSPIDSLFGRFVIIRELGRGGFGVVFLAIDPELNRPVALKLPRAEALLTPEVRLRFVREARAAAALDHPNLVSLYEAGEVNSVCYLASAYCDGPTLAAWLRDREEPVPPQLAAGLVRDLADAVQHAHERGVLHRDIKPSNVLLQRNVGQAKTSESNGHSPSIPWEFTPRITDFGLARLMDRPAEEITASFAAMGSAPYMAPEQAEGKKVGPAADVYGLGAILYALLCRRPPHRGQTDLETLRQVVNDEPVALHRHRRDVPRDLEAVCLKCLEKTPSLRYGSARALAEDLERFLSGEPVRARWLSAPERAGRWCTRNKAVASLLGGIALAMVAGTLISTLFAISAGRAADRSRRDEQKAKKAEAIAEAEAETTRRALYDADMQLVAQLWDGADGTAEQVGTILENHEPSPGKEDLRDFAWYYQRTLLDVGSLEPLYTSTDGALKIPAGQQAPALAFAADGRLLALDGQGELTAWNVGARREVNRVALCGKPPLYLAALSRDGTMAAWVNESRKSVHLLEVAKGQERGVLAADRPISRLAFSADGGTIAAASDELTIRIWHVDTHKLLRTVRFQGLPPREIAVSSGGAILGLANHPNNGAITIHAEGGTPPRIFSTGSTIYSITISPDGRLVASDGTHGSLRLGELAGAAGVDTIGDAQAGWLTRVLFSPDGSRLATGGADGLVTIWDVAQRARLHRFKGHRFVVGSLAFSADGSQLASADGAGKVRVWDLCGDGDAATIVKPPGVNESCDCVAYSPDGRWLATGYGAGVAWLWEARTGRPIRALPVARTSVFRVAFAPDSTLLATGDLDSCVKLWDVSTGRLVRTLAGWPPGTGRVQRSVGSLAFSPDGTRIAAGFGMPSMRESDYGPQMVKVWDTRTGVELAAWNAHQNSISGLAFAPDGSRFATASMDRTVKLWEVGSWRELRTWDSQSQPEPAFQSVTFSTDGATLAAGTFGGSISAWDISTGRKKFAVPRAHSYAAYDLAYSPDGRTLASAGWDRLIKLWDARTGRELRALRGHTAWVTGVAFAPDGQTLASAGLDGTLRVWGALPGWGGRTKQDFKDGPSADEVRRAVELAERSDLKAAVSDRPTADRMARRGWLHAQQGHWSEAASDYAEAIRLRPGTAHSPCVQDLRLRHHHLLLSLAAGDSAGARQTVLDTWHRFGTKADPALANELRLILGMVPDGAADSDTPVRLAELLNEQTPAAQQAVPTQRLGGTLYRAGRYEESIRRQELNIARSGNQAVPQAWAFLAMAHFRLGHRTQALRWLDRARQYKPSADPDQFWSELEIRLLRREAEALVLDPSILVD